MTANVLIVDDLEPNIKLLEAQLLKEYYTVFTATSGQEALDLLKKYKIDVILLDVMMPDMDGFETCRQIKANLSTTHIPIVMVTALSDTEDRIKGLQAGADDFLTKPVDEVALLARVRSLARMKAVIDELKLRNNTNAELGEDAIKMKDSFSGSKILLIDDDVVQAKNIEGILLSISLQVKITYLQKEITKISGIEALSTNIEYMPDLVIISCQLEHNDPLRLSVMLRADIKFYNMVIILLAEEGEKSKSIVIKAMELGINDYFIYPINKEELLARIRTQLRRKNYQDNLRNNLEQSVNLSIKDGLTSVFNRRYFDIHIKQMINESIDTKRSIYLLMCDIDNFKHINDNYGHQAGDIILQTVANTLKNSFQVTDLIARYGGEEFTILLSDLTFDQALYVAERARKNIESINFKIKTQDTPIKNTISIGISQYKKGESISSFIGRSDKAMYKAKTTGKNKVAALDQGDNLHVYNV